MNLNLKELKERKAELLDSMEDMCSNIELFNSTRFNEMKVELEKIETEIFDYENSSVKIENVKRKEDGNKMKLKELLLSNKAVDLSKINAEGEMIRENQGEMIHETFEKTIERKLEDECLLFGLVRKVVTASPHNITIQAEKLDKFLNVKELGAYQKAMPEYRVVQLQAEKYGLIVQLSEELIQDAAFDMEAEVQGQLVEAFARTMEDLILNGDAENGVEGLLMAEEAEEVVADEIDYPTLVKLIHKMPKAMRNDAIFVVADEFIQDLMMMVDLNGRPIWEMNAGDMVDGRFDGKIMGHKVVISPELKGDVKAIFVNMQKAAVLGLRKGMELKRSDQVGFLQDVITLKANCRIDIKLLDEKAIVKFKKGEVDPPAQG